MRVIHTSPEVITEIREDGLFGDCLFFSDDEYWMCASRDGADGAVYAIELQSVMEPHQLDFEGTAEQVAVKELIAICDEQIDAEQAFDFLVDDSTVWEMLDFDCERLSEISWDIQRLQGQIASCRGFDAFYGRDEQGCVWIVPMSGKLHRLERIK